MFRQSRQQRPGYPALDEIEQALRSGSIEALTTDIFDTVVWRTVPEPTDAFVVLGQALADREALDPSLDPRAFGAIRERGEGLARERLMARTGSPEARLQEIWECIPGWCHASLSREEAIGLELEVEASILVPDLDVVELLRVANEAGTPVYAVSDTYFTAEQLDTLLARSLPTDVRFERVFTSSEWRTNKASALFDRVLAAIGHDPRLVAHVGDNADADVRPAEARGISATHLPRRCDRLTGMLRRESAYGRVRALAPRDAIDAARADVAGLDGSLVQLRSKVGLGRDVLGCPEGLRAMWLYGAQVLGPPLAGFADWAVAEAERLDVDRLHCLMREGEFLGELIDSAAHATGSGVETTKLFLNRQVTGVASIGECSREELAQLARRRQGVTTGQFLRMLNVDPVDVPACAGHLDVPLLQGDRLEHTLDAICDDEATRLRVQAHARTMRDRVVRLVERHRAGAEGPMVVVDLGWAASIQRRLARILEQAGADARVDGLYLLTHSGAVETVAGGGRAAGFLASIGHPGVISDAVVRSPEVIEQACMAPHGTQVGLDEGLEPILGELVMPRRQLAEAAAVRDGIRGFQRCYLRYRTAAPEKVRSLGASPDQLAPILARACADPTTEEAIGFGSWQHDDGMGWEQTESLAGGSLPERMRHLSPDQVAETTMADSYWPNAVARLHDPHIADLAAAHAVGLVSREACASPVETGAMVIEAAAGVAIDPDSRVEVEPTRNRYGLSYVSATLTGAHIERVQIRLGARPVLMRVDRLLLRLYVKDGTEELSVRLDQPERAPWVDLINVARVSDRVLGGTADHAYLSFATGHVAEGEIVHRVDVELSFLALAWDGQAARRQGAGESERLLGQLLGSRSWRLTRPLRALGRVRPSRRRH